MHVYLETERLTLREFTEDDAERLFALDTDPDVMRYIGPFMPKSVDESRAKIRSWIEKYYSAGRGLGVWAAIEKSTGEFLGWFCLRPGSDWVFAHLSGWGPDDLEMGYRLHKAAWGKGYATEASRAIVRKAFTELDAKRIVSSALLSNVASWRVMEKVGLKRVQQFPLPGYDSPDVTYALAREDYESGPTV
jgi:RimJ/RimL family protein N-acetyltransferase